MNFIKEFKKGQQLRNAGLPMGLPSLEYAINGIQRKNIYVIAAESKAGKTTLTDYSFLIHPYLHAKEKNIDVDWIYYSLEIDRIEKEFKIACFFFKYDYGIEGFEHDGCQYRLCSEYLLGRLRDNNGNIILIKPEHFEKLKIIYETRIIDMFGEYNEDGVQIKSGKIKIITDKSHPTGIRAELFNYAENNGVINYEEYEKVDIETKRKSTEKRILSYTPNNPDKFTIVIIDHVRKVKLESGNTLKQNIDKLSDYEVQLRNLCGFTFVNVVHLNRTLSSVERMSFSKNKLYPTADDIKDSGNLGEDANVVITMFYPQDDKYNLTTYFDYELINYEQFRSIHVVLSRNTPFPTHIFTEMQGNVNNFIEIKD